MLNGVYSIKNPGANMIHFSKRLTLLIVAACLPFQAARAAAPGEFDYPELLVTPRASDRLDTEASSEDATRWGSYLPLQASALGTLVAGVFQFQNNDPSKDASNVSGVAGLIVGGGWLVSTFALEFAYHPYTSASRESATMAHKSQREQLTRERFAEEAIRAQSRLAMRLKWLSVFTNLGADLYMATQVRSGTYSQVFDFVAAGLALAPIIFRSHYQNVSDEQDDYKKRIYGPVSGALDRMRLVPALWRVGSESASGLAVSYRF
jgi:hypothetical protein